MTDTVLSPRGSAVSFGRELAIATQFVREAGEILKTFYEVPPVVHYKDAREPVTEADRAVNAYLVKQLSQAFPDDGILAEESKDDMTRLHKRRVWIIDPVDGTQEYIDRNGQFCIMVGLAFEGKPVLGLVYQPVDNVLYSGMRGAGAFVEEGGERIPLQVTETTELRDLRPLVSRSHRSPLIDTLMKALGTQRERPLGSVGLKMAAIARCYGDFYVHPSRGTKEWDTCAPEAILAEAGGVMTDCWNRPLRYNQPDVNQRFGVLASNGVCHASLSQAVAQVLDDAGIDADFGF